MREHRTVMRRNVGLGAQFLLAFLVFSLARPAAYARATLVPLPEVERAASDGPRLGILVVGQDAKARGLAGALEQAAEDAVDRAGRFQLLHVSDAWDPTLARARADAAESALAKMKEGQKAIDDLDNQKATEVLPASLAEFRKSDLSRTFKDFLQAWVLVAAGHATGGENTLAKKEIESIVALAPRADFPPQFFPPDLIKFALEQRKIALNAKAELLLRTEPAGARVWVDGVARGTSPVTVDGLMAGKHLVVAALGGSATTIEDASPGEALVRLAPSELFPQYAKTIELITKDPDGVTRDTALRSAGKLLGVDQMLLVLAKKSLAGEKLDLVVERIEVKDGHNPGYVVRTVPVNDAEALGGLLDAALAKDQPRAGKAPVTHFKGGASTGRKIVGFSLMGAGAALVGAGIVCGLQASNKAAEFGRTPQTQTRISQNLATEGRTFMYLADVSYIVGAAALITGGVVAFTSGGGSTIEEPAKKPDTKKKDVRADLKKKDSRSDSKKADEDKKKADEAAKKKADEDKKSAEDDAKKKADDAAEQKKRDDEERKKKDEAERDSKKKKTKKELLEEERKRKEEARLKKEEEARLKKEEEAKKKEEAKLKKDEEARQKKEDEARKKDEELKKKEQDAARKKADEERAAEEARKKKEAEDKKKKEEDDLRNY